MKICVVGLGYIGLPTAAVLAANGFDVLGVDIKKEIIKTLSTGRVHIKEADLDGLVYKVIKDGKLRVATQPKRSDVFIVAVPTPFKKNYMPDISFVRSAIKKIIPFLKHNSLLVIESTCPVGTTRSLTDMIFKIRPRLKGKIFVAYCPERVLPGKILYEIVHNDRIVGGIDEISSVKVRNFYSRFVKGNIFTTDSKTAEMVKLIENSYRDVSIAFANEISMLCDKLEVDVWKLINLANRHPRVKILEPSPGVGGHCIAVDPWFLISRYPQNTKLLFTARKVNLKKTQWVIEKIEKETKIRKIKTIAFFGLSYKPDIDDLRESPAVEIVKYFARKRFGIYVVEPNITSLPVDLKKFKNLKLVKIEEGLKTDLIAFLVAHREFKNIKVKNRNVLKFVRV